MFISEELGEFWWKLHTIAIQNEPTELQLLEVELGKES